MICQNCKKQIPRESNYCMFCGAPIFSADRDEAKTVRVQPVRRVPEPPRDAPSFAAEPPPRSCITCGAALPRGYDGDVCDACLFVQDIAANLPDDELVPPAAPKIFRFDPDFDLDAEYRVSGEPPTRENDAPQSKKNRSPLNKKNTPPREKNTKAAKWLLPVLVGIGAVIVLTIGVLVVPQLLGGDADKPAASEPSTEEQDVISYAQEMVKAAARDPDSVHFDRATVSVSRDVSDFIITQSFERADASGELVAATYEVVLELAPSDGKKYTPLLLKVDEETLYDYR